MYYRPSLSYHPKRDYESKESERLQSKNKHLFVRGPSNPLFAPTTCAVKPLIKLAVTVHDRALHHSQSGVTIYKKRPGREASMAE
jgi:hypothetical protein